MASYYDLTQEERDWWNAYGRLREVKNNQEGYDDAQDNRRKQCRKWLEDRREEIEQHVRDESGGKSEYGPDTEEAWAKNNRRARWTQLWDSSLDGATCMNVCKLPSADATEAEAAYIGERKGWWRIDTGVDTENEQKKLQELKKQNFDWLVERRKYVWRLAEGKIEGEKPGWDHANRDTRYDNLCIATRYGSPYDEWLKTHDAHTGESKDTSSWRDKSAKWHENHLGITEQPADSNCDNREDGIRHAQDTCAGGGTWLRYQPWCGVWAFMGLKAGGVKGIDHNLASVDWITQRAKQGQPPFRKFTTDGSQAKKGDLVILFGPGTHVGTVRSTPSGSYCDTWEGNTSSSDGGSQSNGGGSYKRSRSRNTEVYGYALVEGP